MTPEHRVMNEIRLWCGEHDVLCFRCNVGKVRAADGSWFDTGLPNGFPDLLILDNHGHTLYCEVKALKGRQSEDQVRFMGLVRSKGHHYIVARSAEDVESALAALNDPPLK